MAIVDKKTFAGICGKPTNSLSVSINRDKTVIVLSDGKIDTDDPRNKAFIDKWANRDGNVKAKSNNKKNKNKKPDAKNRTTSSDSDDENVDDIEQGPGQSFSESERLLKYYDTVKRKVEIEKLELQLQKTKGEVVPTSSIKPIFLQHNQSIITALNNKTAEYVRLFSKKHSLTVEEIAELKGSVVNWVNEYMGLALEVSLKGIDVVVEDYSESKNVGEHG